MAKSIPQTRNVIAAFTSSSRIPNRRLNIPRRGRVIDLVCDLLTNAEADELIGVMDATGNTWID